MNETHAYTTLWYCWEGHRPVRMLADGSGIYDACVRILEGGYAEAQPQSYPASCSGKSGGYALLRTGGLSNGPV